MNIYLDFDRTLFDTDSFYANILKIIDNNGIDIELFNTYKKKLMSNGFNPKDILTSLKKEITFDEKVYNEIDEMIKKSYQYVYDDVINFLQKAKEKSYHLYILSMGNKDYQMEKIKYSNLLPYFDDVIITLKLKGELSLDYANSIFIDDSKEEIESILLRQPKKVYQIVRCPISLCNKVTKIEQLEDIWQ